MSTPVTTVATTLKGSLDYKTQTLGTFFETLKAADRQAIEDVSALKVEEEILAKTSNIPGGEYARWEVVRALDAYKRFDTGSSYKSEIYPSFPHPMISPIILEDHRLPKTSIRDNDDANTALWIALSELASFGGFWRQEAQSRKEEGYTYRSYLTDDRFRNYEGIIQKERVDDLWRHVTGSKGDPPFPSLAACKQQRVTGQASST